MSPFAQLFSLGLVWVTFHCAGMCGPIVIGFDIAGATRGVSTLRGGLRLLIYQAGRATTLATLGAFAGLGGHALKAAFEPGAAVFTLLFGATLLIVTLVRALPKRAAPLRPKLSIDQPRQAPGQPPGAPQPPAARGPLAVGSPSGLRPLAHVYQWMRELSLTGTPSAVWLLGVLMGFMPCMIVIWALGLAGATTSPLEGAALMTALVAMTTPVLLGATLLPRVLPAAWRARLPNVLLGISGTWLVMVGLAGLELVPHLSVSAWGHMVMFW